MEKHSYDVPAYKFGIVKLNDHRCRVERSYQFYRNQIERDNVTIIPFENVDGLTVSEVQDFLGVEEILFIAYLNYKSRFTDDTRYKTHIKYQLFIEKENLKSNKTTPIDELIEKTLEDNYNAIDENCQRIYNCYFTRYQDKSYEITKQRIKALKDQNN